MQILMALVSGLFFVLLLGLALENPSLALGYGLIGLISTGILIALDKGTKKEHPNDISEKLSSLEKLLERERISHEEFEAAKKELFDKNASKK